MTERFMMDKRKDRAGQRQPYKKADGETCQFYSNEIKEFSIIRRIINSMKFIPDLAKVYLTIVDVIIDETKAENCSLMLVDGDTGKLVVRAAKGEKDREGRYYDQDFDQRIGLGTGEGVAGKVVRDGKSYLVSDTKEEKLFVEHGESSLQIRSLLCTPIHNKDEVIGVFNLSSSRPGIFSRNDQLLLGTIANLASSTLQTSIIHEKLQKLNEKLQEKVEEKTAVLRASEQKYRALVQNAKDSIFIFQDGMLKYTNRSFEKMMGFPDKKDSYGKPKNNFINCLEQCLMEGKSAPGLKEKPAYSEFEIIKEDGGKVEAEVSMSDIQYEGAKAIQGIVRDITSRKELEKMKANFVAMAAHELRTPIFVVTGYNKMLLKEIVGPLNDRQKQILKESSVSCERLTNFAKDIIEFSQIEAGKTELDLQEGDIGRCIKDAFREVITLAEKKDILIEEVIFCPDIPKIHFDKNKIVQVMVNLTQNAITYTHSGGKIAVKIKKCSVNDFLEVWVMDNGIGVPPVEREVIFDEFKVGRKSRDTGKEGIGLGLAICKKIIEAHRGKIWVEPREGGGSKFIFTLPLT